jgi:transglutaminase-like putative cysteine protease
MVYQDSEGNVVHHFNIPRRHAQLTLTAHALVECSTLPDVPPHLPPDAWQELDAVAQSGECWDLLAPSKFAETTHALFELARAIGLGRGADPLSTLRGLMTEMYARFEYSPQATRVDSRIDEALQARRGVCQDFSHIFIALARHLGIPTRYVSGYLFRDEESADRSSDGATHAWAEALMPGLGWVGFDPTNNVVAGERHIRVAIGRDYADVPPTRGIYKGMAAIRSDLAVAVCIGPVTPPHAADSVPFTPWMSHDVTSVPRDADAEQQQQQ